MKRISIGFVAMWICLLGCVGTDFINDASVGMPARIEISPTTAAVQIDSTIDFQATYFDTLGNSVPATTYQWTSSNTAIASIDENGLAIGQQPGQVMILASAEGINSEALLTVVSDPNQVASVIVIPDSSQISVGESLQFIASAWNLNGDVIEGLTFSWSSSNPNIATIDDNGLATAIIPGVVDIVAETDGIESVPARLAVLGQSRTGMFTKREGTSYTVSGTATLEERADGSLVLEIGRDFVSSNGPGLEVFLSHNNTVNSQSRNLGRLESTSGAQSYDVPPGIELTTFDWVIIHCVPFNVTFGFAELK